jgi:hypothetical protein
MENGYKRKCPGCGKDIYHSTEAYCKSMERKKTLCKSCGCRNPDRLRRMSEINSGEKNPFFGKRHTDATRIRIANRDYSCNSTQVQRDRVSIQVTGSGNPMYGRKVYDVWLEKYGKDEADRRRREKAAKTSKQCSGMGNPMYGKPSPQGSGNGWSGWYKGWYFRSLKELSYVILVIEANGCKWRSAESKDLRVSYIANGVDKTYFADFLVDEKILVEVKPKKLMNSWLNSLKRDAALRFCKERGYSYRMVDVRTLEERDVIGLYRSGTIHFIDRYDVKMKQRLALVETETK